LGKGRGMRESKKFEELEQSISLTVKTKCPEKYFLVDRETGDIFVGSIMGHWDRFESITKDS